MSSRLTPAWSSMMDRHSHNSELGLVSHAEDSRPESSLSWGLRMTSASLTGDRMWGGADCCLVVGEDLLQDVQPDGLQGPLDHLRLHPGGQALAVSLPALGGGASVGALAAPAGPCDPVGGLCVQEEFNGGGDCG